MTIVRRPRWLLVCLVLAILAGPAALSAADAVRGTAGGEGPRIGQLNRQLQILRHERDRHLGDEFMKPAQQHAFALETEGLKGVKDANLLDAAKELADVGLEKLAKAAVHGTSFPTKEQAEAAEKLTANVFKSPTNFTKSAYDFAEQIHKNEDGGHPPRSVLDANIARAETYRKGLGAVGSLDFTGAASTYVKIADSIPTAYLAGAYLRRSLLATDPTERAADREKALTEAAKVVTNVAEIAEVPFLAEIKLGQANAEIWSRLAYWAGAAYAANGERAFAAKVRNDAVDFFNYQILVTQYEIDQAERRQHIVERRAGAAKPQPEPGGIKMSGIAADHLAARIDLTGIDYDPVGGRLILTGRQSEQAIDLDIFRDVLRLAIEHHDPFFSLNLVEPKDWDRKSIVASELLDQAWMRSPERRGRFVARLRQIGRRLPYGDGDRECYMASTRDFDPALHRQVESRLDIREERVYSPEWLAHSKVGKILFEADLAIKAVAAGLIETDEGVSVAKVWGIEGFRPIWLDPEPGYAGRANFEIDDAKVPIDGSFLDLSQVKPKLVMTRREPGTTRDLPPGERDQRVSRHFDQHWRDYVDAVPILGELMTVFRAYVAARYLVRSHPGLVQRILAIGEPVPGTGTPLYFVRASHLIACVQGDKPVALKPGAKGLFYYVGSGFGGGVTVGLRRDGRDVITYQPTALAAGGGAGVLARRLSAADAPPVYAEGEERGLVLAVDAVEPMPLDDQGRAWALWLGGTALAATLAALHRRRQGPAAAAGTCPHCRHLHHITESIGWLADVVAVATFAFLLWLPFALAGRESETSMMRMAIAGAAVVAAVALPGLVAALVQICAGRGLGWSTDWGGAVRWLGAGARWLGAAAALVLVAGGIGLEALGNRLIALAGPTAGEPLLAALGPPSILAPVALVLLGAWLAAAVARWLAPFLFDSRPLPIAHAPHRNEVPT